MLKAGRQREKQQHAKPHVRKNDTVVILSGKDRGKQGKVMRVYPSKGTALIERANMVKKHTRPNPQRNVQGGILEKESPIPLSKLQVVCPSCGESSRVGAKVTDEGTTRICRKCDAELG